MGDLTDNTVVLIVAVALAGAAGAALRSVISERLNNEFPFGTLAINLGASFALGLIVGTDSPIPTVVGIGALGALSTWSVAAAEAAEMARTGRGSLAMSYLGLLASTGVLTAWFGLQLGPMLFG